MTLSTNGTTLDNAKAKDGRRKKMKRKLYEKKLRELQVGLCRLQDWVKNDGLRIIIVFEGRDTAGKGGMIKTITERGWYQSNPRLVPECRRQSPDQGIGEALGLRKQGTRSDDAEPADFEDETSTNQGPGRACSEAQCRNQD